MNILNEVSGFKELLKYQFVNEVLANVAEEQLLGNKVLVRGSALIVEVNRLNRNDVGNVTAFHHSHNVDMNDGDYYEFNKKFGEK